MLKFTYWRCQNLNQAQVRQQLQLGTNTGVDWDMFCREVCEVVIVEGSELIGDEGKKVQIDESKIGKSKRHKGHRVEGQWFFGGSEEESRKCFIFLVDCRDQDTFLPIIQKWIMPGTLIISDCWKSYDKLKELGYGHEKVNHSEEFVNEGGYHTNKLKATGAR